MPAGSESPEGRFWQSSVDTRGMLAGGSSVAAVASSAAPADLLAVADPAVAAYATWLAESLSQHQQGQARLTREVSAVREASAVGAATLVELRAAVHQQLQQVVVQMQRLEQDLAATKLELAEVVIDKETIEGHLTNEIEDLRGALDGDMQALKSHSWTLNSSLREMLEQQVNEATQKCEKAADSGLRDCNSLRISHEKIEASVQQLEEREVFRDNAAKHLVERVEEGKQETMGYFSKIDKIMNDEARGVVPMLDELRQARIGLEKEQEVARQVAKELKKDIEDYQKLRRIIEPRVTQLEETQRTATAERETLHKQVKDMMHSRHSSPSDGLMASTKTEEQPRKTESDAAGGSHDSWRWDTNGNGSPKLAPQSQQHAVQPTFSDAARSSSQRQGQPQQAFRASVPSPSPVVNHRF